MLLLSLQQDKAIKLLTMYLNFNTLLVVMPQIAFKTKTLKCAGEFVKSQTHIYTHTERKDNVVLAESSSSLGQGKLSVTVTKQKPNHFKDSTVWLHLFIKLNPVISDNLEGWDGVGDRREIQKGGDTRILVVD